MTTKLIRTIAAAAAVLVAGLALAACSSDNATGPTDAQVQDAVGTTTAKTATTEATTTEAAPTTTQAASADGKEIFTTNCAGCHTLAAAGASGQVGPNLDQTKPSEALAIDRVTNGKAGMPAFEGQLSPEEITAVATYVADNAGA